MNYKKIFPSQKLRIKLLNMLAWVPDPVMLRIQYFIKFNRVLRFKNPKRYTEKIQHYKYFYRNPLIKQCSDKYDVRDYVRSLGLENILNKQYGVYDTIEQVDFSKLPNKFVIKTTDGGGGQKVFFCKDKKNLNKKMVFEKFKFTPKPKKNIAREWGYQNRKRKIIIEEYLEDPGNQNRGLNDYKFFCFKGTPKYVVLDYNRFQNHQRNFYDIEWNLLDVSSDKDKIKEPFSKPENFSEMMRVAELISSPFPALRVDLFNVNGKVRFGEMTFYPWSGYIKFNPDEFDYILGEHFEINYMQHKRRPTNKD